jgi:hypothetical protein
MAVTAMGNLVHRRSSDPAMVTVMIGNSQPLAEGSL